MSVLCKPLERIDDVTRCYGLRETVQGHFHFQPDDIYVERREGKLELTRGDTPKQWHEIDANVRDFINDLFANRSVRNIVLGKTHFLLMVTEGNAWGNVEPHAIRLAEKMHLERKAFLAARPPAPRTMLPATA